jgi:hypothetical protein
MRVTSLTDCTRHNHCGQPLGHLEFDHITLQVLSNPDIRVMIYTPLGETRVKLERFVGTSTAPRPQEDAAPIHAPAEEVKTIDAN